jgi:hypothetical protein
MDLDKARIVALQRTIRTIKIKDAIADITVYVFWAVTIALIATIVSWCTQANAQIVDDAHLRHVCLTKQPGEQAACAGYVMGVIDTSARPHPFCIPQTLPPETVVNRVEEYIARNPNHLPGAEQVTLALKAVWPCTTRAPQISIQVPLPNCMFCYCLPRGLC